MDHEILKILLVCSFVLLIGVLFGCGVFYCIQKMLAPNVQSNMKDGPELPQIVHAQDVVTARGHDKDVHSSKYGQARIESEFDTDRGAPGSGGLNRLASDVRTLAKMDSNDGDLNRA